MYLWSVLSPHKCMFPRPAGETDKSSRHQRALSRRNRGGQVGGAGEPGVDRGGGGATLGDRPDDQRLAAARVAGDEDAVDRGQVAVVARDVAAVVELHAELLDQAL